MTVRVGFLGAGLIATYHSKSLHVSGADVAWGGVYDLDEERARQFAAASGATACALRGRGPRHVRRRLRLHVDGRAPPAGGGGRGTGAGGVLREAPRRRPGRRHGDGRHRRAGRRGQPGRPRPAPLACVRDAEGRRRRPEQRPADERGVPGRPVHPDPGRLPLDVARRRDQGGGRHAARALDPRPRHARARAGSGGQCVGRDRARSTRSTGSKTSRPCCCGSPTARRARCSRCGTTCSSVRACAGSSCSASGPTQCSKGDWFGPVEWQTTGQAPSRLDGSDLIDEAGRRGAALGNPDELFIDAVVRGEPAWPTFADALRAHTLADAVYRSAADGGAPVTVS